MKVTAIVPVYNEEKTVGNVLNVLKSSNQIDEIIVVDDGSTDNTPNIIKRLKSKKIGIITLRKNMGKGNAIQAATKNIKSDVILFVDADLIGLKKIHVQKLLEPVLSGNAAMTIGLRDKKNFIRNTIMLYFPLIGGERAILTKVFMAIRKNPLIGGWGLEIVMNDYCKKKNLKIVKVKLNDLDHVMTASKKSRLIALLKEIYVVGMTKIKVFQVKYN